VSVRRRADRWAAIDVAIKRLKSKAGAPASLFRDIILHWIEMPREEKQPRKKPSTETPQQAITRLAALGAAIINLRKARAALGLTSIEELSAAKQLLGLKWPPPGIAWRYHSPYGKPSAEGTADFPMFHPSMLAVLDDLCPGIDGAIKNAQKACERRSDGAEPWQGWRDATADMLAGVYVRLTGDLPGTSRSGGPFLAFVKAIFKAAGDNTNPGRYARDAAKRVGRTAKK
jgi:hypothetical protein